MHIPDGYLSPSTCLALYGASTPFWYGALQRVKKLQSTRLIPLLSVFAAFSFVVMMFNLPLPGGTTGHAVGVALAAIVLGPWGSILAVSAALLIQAVLFGDGGITTLGANCFNMAIVGSLVSYGVYRLAAGRAPLTARRRAVAAGLAGYVAINAAALCAGIEFGIQPALFKSASGAPLYAPYPLKIAIPAMLIGHLTFAGLAELVLLKLTAPADLPAEEAAPAGQSAPGSLRPLWMGLALLLFLTPLGILAGGAAWGEWTARDFADPAARQEIAEASRNVAPPAEPPRGIERLSRVWTAPFPAYAPAFIRQRGVGYLLSAMFGAGALILIFLGGGAVFGRLHGPRGRPQANGGT
jgi:cobalt/nickel transport system permease protein